MKKLFLGICYIVAIILSFTYYLIPAMIPNESLFVVYAYTGIPVVGWLFLVPSFIFVILGMTMNSSKCEFLRDVLNFFSAIFTIGTILLGVFDRGNTIGQVFVFVVLAVCSAVLLAGSVYGIVIALMNEKKNKELKAQETESKEVM